MASVLKVDKLDPQSGTALELGTSGDTISVPSGATLDISASTLTPPATMPASSAANLTNIPGANITGTIAAVSGANLTSLTATNLGSGTVPTARLGSGTASSSTVLYGDQTYKAEPGGGISDASQWRVTTSSSGDAAPISSNWAVASSYGYGSLGSAMTESSGIFTFPSTGFWLVSFACTFFQGSTSDKSCEAFIYTTIDNSNYNLASRGDIAISFVSSATNLTAQSQFLFDVTSTTDCKCKFHLDVQSASTQWAGASDNNFTYATFVRLADT
jgi:hypothetical protein